MSIFQFYFFNSKYFHLLIIAVFFLLTRIIFLQTPAGQLGDADQAVFGMMAQKIAALEEFPIYCWEAHYAGAPVSYISAAIFQFWGSGFVQLRWAMLMIIFPAYILFYFIYRRLFNRQAAFVGVLFLVFAPFLVLDFTTAAYGGYGESFLGAALIILLSWKIDDRNIQFPIGIACFFWGLICGFFTYIQLYVFPIVLAFSIPVIWRFSQKRTKVLWTFFIGGLVGVLPLVIYNILNNAGTLTRGAGWILRIGREDASMPLIEVIGKIMLQKGAYLKAWLLNAPLMFGQYLVPPIFGNTIRLVAGMALIAIFLLYIIHAYKGIGKEASSVFYHRQFAFYLFIFTLFQWVISLYAVRHFMPLFVVVPVVLIGLAEVYPRIKKGALIVLMLMAASQLFGWYHEFKTPRFDPRPVINTMKNEGISEFYASYWIAFPVMFLGNGSLVGAPLLLSCREPFVDRRPQYTEQVVSSRDAAFVFGAEEEKLEMQFLSFLKEHNITYKTNDVDHVRLFFGFSKPVGVYFYKENWCNYFFLK